MSLDDEQATSTRRPVAEMEEIVAYERVVKFIVKL